MKEEEICPAKIFDEYLRLAREDTDIYLGTAERKNGGCPACETKGVSAFVKYGFSYETCTDCLPLFIKKPLMLDGKNFGNLKLN